MNSSSRFISLIGAGYWGKNLLRDLNELDVLHSCCEKNDTLRERFAKQYPNVLFLSDIDELQNYSQVTAVCIATPATTHYALCRECLLLGYDVFVEKPLALKYSEGQELVQLAEDEDRILMVGHILQYHPAMVKIKEMIQNDMIGKIQYIKSNRLNLGKIRTGENVLWSFAPHDISIILSLVDEEMPHHVLCSGLSVLNPPISDATTTILQFEEQYAEISVNWLYPYKEQSLIIVGDQGMITFKDDRDDPCLNYYPQPVTHDDRGDVMVNKKEPLTISLKHDMIKDGSPLLLECRHFVECVQSRRESLTNGHEALRVLGVLELAQRSLDNHGTRVSLKDLKNRGENLRNPENQRYFKHASATVENNAKIGQGTKIWRFCHLMNCTVGENCSFGMGSFVGNDVVLGDNCRIQNNVNIYTGVVCESGVFFGPNSTTTNDKNPRAEFSKMGKYSHTYIRKGATIGAGAVILSDLTLGKYCMIGAGAVVTKDVPDYAIMVGNPAKQIGTIDEWGNRRLFSD